MNIVLVRVDNRLVHGQILEGWVPYTQATCIIVVDDHVASDFFRETVIKMAVPRDIEVIISTVEDFPNHFHYGEKQGKKAMVLFSDLYDAVRAYRGGFRFDRLNIGNIHNEECLKECSPSVLLGTVDIAHIDALLKEGVTIELRRVPRDKAVDIRDALADPTIRP